MSDGVRCMWMRGGTSKGGYFLADDLPEDRDAFLLRMMGSPDVRQIDGMEFFDLEYDVSAFKSRLPRVRVIEIDEFDSLEFI